MTLFLRTKNNHTILDLDVWVKTEDDHSFVEISSSVDIKNYSILLIAEKEKFKQIQMINDFDELSELRGWLWEVYFSSKVNKPEYYDDVVGKVKKMLVIIANRYELYLVED